MEHFLWINDTVPPPYRSFVKINHHGSWTAKVKRYRLNSVGTVYQYADYPIRPNEHRNGKQTKSSILANLTRAKSASNICCRDSWIDNRRRLCEIRCNYKDISAYAQPIPRYKNTKLNNHEIIKRFLSGTSSSLENKQSLLQKRSASKQQHEHKSQLSINGGKILCTKSQGVNTERKFTV
ncbi:uncharacterized protein LOC130636229 [Hydractinia symbiolongicarpus]|uniref:uncharacterized protein LOC130636229 n=1 Tax=Hydractinia symbiolongicarpus TaxID=13093 RepID=UPI0025503D47|nr:uncharacterized protein LOC130636229 [Hydractinia symbiolongicarpus]